jgi:hypothetical protein
MYLDDLKMLSCPSALPMGGSYQVIGKKGDNGSRVLILSDSSICSVFWVTVTKEVIAPTNVDLSYNTLSKFWQLLYSFAALSLEQGAVILNLEVFL